MKISPGRITSPVFHLIRTIEFDLELGNETWPTRLELFQAIGDPKQFRCQFWQAEFFRIQPTFPQDSFGDPKHGPSDELILVEWTGPPLERYRCFQADTAEAALQLALQNLNEFLERTSSEESGRRGIRL